VQKELTRRSFLFTISDMTLAIIGSREFDNYKLLSETVKRYFCSPLLLACEVEDMSPAQRIFPYIINFDKFVSGGAKGADSLGKKFCESYNKHAKKYNLGDFIEIKEFLPDWDKYGKRAGFLRNQEIINNADVVLAFWDGKSKGTQHSIGLAKEQKKTTIIVYFE